MSWVLVAASVALGADVWARIEASDEHGAISLQVPAQALLDLGQLPIRSAYSGPVDLAALAHEVEAGGPGTTRRVHVTVARGQVATLVLTAIEPSGPEAEALGVTVVRDAEAVELSLPLARRMLVRALRDVEIGVDLAALGLALTDRRSVEMVRRRGPTVLVDVHATSELSSVRIETR